jgi:hypothetical protein
MAVIVGPVAGFPLAFDGGGTAPCSSCIPDRTSALKEVCNKSLNGHNVISIAGGSSKKLPF